MTRKRTRHPAEPRIHGGAKIMPNGIWEAHTTTDGRVFNGRSNKPMSPDPEAGKLKRQENLAEGFEDNKLKASTVAIIQSGAVLRPHQIANVRQRIVNVVEKHISHADEVLDGLRDWSAPQTSLFMRLLDKVAPNMTETMHRHTMQGDMARDYSKLTRMELEAALADVLDEAKVIDVVPEEGKPEKKKDRPYDTAAFKKRRAKTAALGLKATRARILETKEPTVLPPLTRAQDNEKRRQMKAHADYHRKKVERRQILENLELLGQLDPVTPAPVTPALDPPEEQE